MAEEIQIQGSNERGKLRNPLAVIGLRLHHARHLHDRLVLQGQSNLNKALQAQRA